VGARLLTQQREAGRESRVGPGAVLVDDEIFHQYYFVPGPVGERAAR
jgi:hypothetical protein